MSRRRPPTEDGFTLVEMIVATAVLLVLALMAFYGLSTMSASATLGQSRAQADTVFSSAINQIRLEVTSANIIFNPATEGGNAGTSPDGASIPAGFSLRIYTQNNGVFTCMQWRVLDTGSLQVRSWNELTGAVKNWTTLVTGISNPTSDPPFVLDQGANFGGSGSSRLLDVDLVLGGPTIPTPIQVQTAIAGRDAEYYPQNTGDCSPVPSP